ncbi:MAG TPA: (2Fe-2S)-binding protein [Chloroflexota bacterium]|jgi:aerobic-type carbon monoxide dehydrogenase small subunit (CoxS/CutS family)|nr:(2Fe-2S)-binding protein [Chloroflexota bacterium]
MKRELTLRVNGREQRAVADTHHTLLEVLRRELRLFSVREGCGVGMCGACTVLLDGQPVSSCLLLAHEVRGRSIETVEGLAQGGTLHPIQEAFIEHTAFQCSFCTPGMILATKALLAENPDPTEEEIADYLAGNLCRCGSYLAIIEAVRAAAERWRAVGALR